MNKRGFFWITVAVVVGLIVIGVGLRSIFSKSVVNPILYLNESQKEKIDDLLNNKSVGENITIGADECSVDSDCVPDSCCHAKGCVVKAKEPDCFGIYCTQSCEPGTLDCGQGSCICENKRCKAVING